MDEKTGYIKGNDRSVNDILNNKRYKIDYFQREYRWETKHVEKLLEDLEAKFLTSYKKTDTREDISRYGRYYLGPIVISSVDGELSIIDGQQRLTTLTLLLMFLRNLVNKPENKGLYNAELLSRFIKSEKFGKTTYNLNIENRNKCLDSLYEGRSYKVQNGPETIEKESIENLNDRYNDIVEIFPYDTLGGNILPFFIDWLLEYVIFIEITTNSNDDAYTIFETMNDRGLDLTSTEMLKGWLLSEIKEDVRNELNVMWMNEISELNNELGKNTDLNFFPTWLRAKYAESLRQGKKGAPNEDFEKVSKSFHAWVRDNKKKTGLESERGFESFITNEFKFFIDLYKRMYKLENNPQSGLETLYYSAYTKKMAETLRHPLYLAAIKTSDDIDIQNQKLNLVSKFVETFIVLRSVNNKTLSHSSIRYTIYSLIKKLRDKDIKDLDQILKDELTQIVSDGISLDGMKDFGLNDRNKRVVRFLLARITYYIEEQSNNVTSSIKDYLDHHRSKPYEIEHIWRDKFDDHKEFSQRDEWEDYRNMIGDLLLLPEDFNKSYGADTYEQKLPHYHGQNLLAKSLNDTCYERNPSFKSYIEKSKLPFKSYAHFNKTDLEERQELYKRICQDIYRI